LLETVLVKVGGHDAARFADRFHQLSGLAPATCAGIEDAVARLCAQHEADQLGALLLGGKRALLVAGQRSGIACAADTQSARRQGGARQGRIGLRGKNRVGDIVSFEVGTHAQIN
jgi:hypothetical protein